MKTLLAAISLFFCLTSINGASYDTIPANNGLIEYTGRIDFSDPLVPKFSYSGVSIRACFTGTSIGIIMNDNVGNNYYNIILDGRVIDTLQVTYGKKTYYLAETLENKTHEIEIFKRTELDFGKSQFYGFLVDKGSSLVTIVNKRDKLIEYIGNSITCGYGNEGANGGTFGPTTENHYLTYAAITSRNFNARHLAVCKSGIGIYRNYNDPITGSVINMTDYYTRTFLTDVNPKYSFAITPDVVCIDLGTNDFSTTGGDPEKFKSYYYRLIDTIQTKYTDPDIICLVGPMLSGASLDNVKSYVKTIADSANKKGKGNVYFFEMSQQGSLGYGIDYHPTVAQHKKNASELTNFIKSIKGWNVTPLPLSATTIDVNHLKLEMNTTMKKESNTSGFRVYGNGNEILTDSVSIDATNKAIINIYLKQNISVGENVSISYMPGSVESEDAVVLGNINMFDVKNILTETKLTSGSIAKTSESATLTFNKSIIPPKTTDGFSIFNNQGEFEIDSFSVSGTQMTFYLKNKVMKGDSVFVSFSGATIFGKDGIALNNITRFALKNNSSYTNLKILGENTFVIYPNPNSTGTFNYILRNSTTAILNVYSINGQMIYSQKLTKNQGRIDLSQKVTKGIYHFSIITDNQEYKSSIIIK